jgi:serine/threonine-protein kinase
VGLGRTVLDRFLLVKPLARGGVSLVYEAVDTSRMQPAAVKVLSPELARNRRHWQAARQEPLIMERLRHPTVPMVYDYGNAFVGGAAEVPCMAMELLTGAPLTGLLASHGPMPWRSAVEVAAMIAEMLAVAHRRGIVHRDLTPDNVMFTTEGVKIIDFGLASLRPESTRMSRWLRPDAGGNECHPPHDVYALGVLLCQMLTGRSPYPGGGPMLRPAATPVLNVPGIPRSVADLCRWCMAKRPGDRPTSATVALALWAELLPADATHYAPVAHSRFA